MSFKKQFLNDCTMCNHSGYIDESPCECRIKARIYNRMVNSGFSKGLIDLVSSDAFNMPMFIKGEFFFKYFLDNPKIVEDRGLSLYIHSQERGRGKTTLAHYLVYKVVQEFSKKENYRSARTYKFMNVEDLLNDLRKSEQEELWKATWLVLDDLGNENKVEWKRDLLISSLQRIMHYRRDHSLPTVITTNYEPMNLARLYRSELNSLFEIKADGSIGGLLFRGVELGGGEDYRTMTELSAWPEEKENL